MLHPRDWEIKDKKKRKGRLTIKTPKWALDTIKNFKTLQADYQYQLSEKKKHLRTLREELKNIEARKRKLPEMIMEQEESIAKSQVEFDSQIGEFNKFKEEAIQLSLGRKKKKRARKTPKTHKTHKVESTQGSIDSKKV